MPGQARGRTGSKRRRRVGRPILAAAGFSRLPALPRPPGDIQAPPLFREISRAAGSLQQTTQTDRLFHLQPAAQRDSVSQNSGNDTDAASEPSMTDSPSPRSAATANAIAMRWSPQESNSAARNFWRQGIAMPS